MSRRSFTPHELRQKSTSILDQLELIAEDWRCGDVPAAAEVDAVTAAVADLRAEVERTARIAPVERTAAMHLVAARTHVDRALALVDELTGDRTGGGAGAGRMPAGSPADADARRGA